MFKKSFICLIVFFSIAQVWAQENTKNLYLGLGGTYSTFQDVKYSNVRYNGFGSNFKIGYEIEAQNALWGITLLGAFTAERPKTHNATESKTSNISLEINYLRKLPKGFYVGASWSIADYYGKNFTNLGNNSSYFIASSNLWLSAKYDYKKFRFGADLGVLSFIKESTGFSFSAPQQFLEDGNFNYQNENAESPFGFKEYTLITLPKHFHLRTQIAYRLNDRIQFDYNWQFRKYAEVKNYPVTYGIHTLSVRYNIIHRKKDTQ